MDEMQRFKETYITECFELLEDMESKLFGLSEARPDMEELNAIFRCAHSIKGGSGAFGFDNIKNFTHILEGLLDGMREGKIMASRQAIDALLASVDIVRQMVSCAQNNSPVAANLGDEVAVQLQAIAGNNVTAQATNGKTLTADDDDEISIYDIDFKPKPGLFHSGNEPLLIINELKTLGSILVTADYSALPQLNKLDPESCYVWWNFTLETSKNLQSVREIFEFVEDDCALKITKIAGFDNPNKAAKSKEVNDLNAPEPTAIANKPATKPDEHQEEAAAKTTQTATSIRIDVDKVDRLVNMVGEIVITQAMIAAQAGKLHLEDFPELSSGLQILSQHTIELQEAVMSVRMQPVKSVFSRMPRIVRDLSRQLSKDIKLEMFGENTEIDKTVIEQLSDPLMHMIRNSVDHGIDGPQSRLARGKAAQGIITLSAEHTGGKIVIRITDDGRGINREKVLQKAIEKGLVKPGDTLTDLEIDNIIFMAGFSTADIVSDVSGRGVGMDVVKRNIEGLGGSVNVISKTGEGTSFIVTLPLTLAILDGMIIRVGDEKYIIPISNIIETLKPGKDDIRQIAGANDLVNVRGEFVPLVYLYKTFAVDNAKQDTSESLVVLVEAGASRFGLVVDELIGQQQVVIKSLEENSSAVAGISAATILGDGRVSLILDVAQLYELSAKMARKQILAEV